MLSPKEKGKPESLIATRNRSPVSIAESRATWWKNARSPRPDAQNAIGLEEATSRDAPRHQRSKQPLKNPLHLGIRDPAPFKKWWSQGLFLWHAWCRRQGKSQSALINLGDQSDSRSVHTTSPLNYSQMGSSTGSELAWDSKPALNSVYAPTPIETPEPLRCILNCNICRDIVLKLNIAPVRQNRCFSRIEALLDSRANTIFIDRKWVQIRKIPLLPLPNPILVYNMDGTRNSSGNITLITLK